VDGIIMEVKPSQPKKANASIVFTEAGMVKPFFKDVGH